MAEGVLILLTCTILAVSAWSPPYVQPAQVPGKKFAPPPPAPVKKFAPPPSPYRHPVKAPEPSAEEAAWSRSKRDHYGDDDHHHHHHDHHRHGNTNGGVTGPVHTFVKTDKKANYKWGVRHHVGPKYV